MKTLGEPIERYAQNAELVPWENTGYTTACHLDYMPRCSGSSYTEAHMKIHLPKLFHDPDAPIAQIAELRERVAALHQIAGPDLRKFIDSYDFSFSTMNALLRFGERLTKGVAILKESVGKLQKLAESNDPGESMPACPNGNGC